MNRKVSYIPHIQTLTFLAVPPLISGDTKTRVLVDSVSARRSISARTAGAFVDIYSISIEFKIGRMNKNTCGIAYVQLD